jgi:hypothetical protein
MLSNRKKASRHLSSIANRFNGKLTGPRYARYLRGISCEDNEIEIIHLCHKFIMACSLLDRNYNTAGIKELKQDLESRVGVMKCHYLVGLFNLPLKREKDIKKELHENKEVSVNEEVAKVNIKSVENTAVAIEKLNSDIDAKSPVWKEIKELAESTVDAMQNQTAGDVKSSVDNSTVPHLAINLNGNPYALFSPQDIAGKLNDSHVAESDFVMVEEVDDSSKVSGCTTS